MPALAALLLCASALAVLVTTAPTDQQQVRYERHAMQALKFKCREPQPRSVLSSDLVEVGPSESIYPPFTVLHRCDGSTGCCVSRDRICDVRDTEEVTLVFLVKDSVQRDREVKYREATFTNHTRCHCVSREPQPPK